MNFITIKRRPLQVLQIALAMVLFSTCEEKVDLPHGIEEPKLVVSSSFFPDDFVSVRLSATQPTAGEQTVAEITDATVAILDGDETAEVLEYVPGPLGTRGSYKSTVFKPLVGRLYTLIASSNGFLPINAESAIPESIPITELEVTDLEMKTEGNLHVYDFSLTLDYDDPPLDENFYDLRISQYVVPFRVNSNGDTTKMDAKAKVVQSPEDEVFGESAIGEASILVRDRPTSEGVVIRLQSRFDPRFELLGNLRAELRTVSQPYFDYHLNLQREGQALPVGLGKPRVNSFGNVQDGVGIFAGYNRVVRTFRLGN